MTDSLAGCSWPRLAKRHAQALRDAVAFILAEVEPLGIVASGTIVRGAAHATSDLDLIVVHRAPYRRRVQRYFGDGVPAEVFINPPARIRAYFAEEHAEGRPITAHMLATGHVVLARDAIVGDLLREATAWLERPSRPGDADVVRERYGAATLFEDATDVAAIDPTTATLILGHAVTSMLELFCRTVTGAIPRRKDLLPRVAEIDPVLGHSARLVFSDASFPERLAAAGIVADRTIEARGFFEWDSGPEPTPEALPQ